MPFGRKLTPQEQEHIVLGLCVLSDRIADLPELLAVHEPLTALDLQLLGMTIHTYGLSLTKAEPAVCGRKPPESEHLAVNEALGGA